MMAGYTRGGADGAGGAAPGPDHAAAVTTTFVELADRPGEAARLRAQRDALAHVLRRLWSERPPRRGQREFSMVELPPEAAAALIETRPW